MLLLSTVRSRHSVHDCDENTTPFLNKQASTAKNSQALTLENFQRIFQETMKASSSDPDSWGQPPVLSLYADIVPSPQQEAPKLQLVWFQQPAAEDKTVFVSDDLENLVNYRSFHRLSGDQYREAHFSAYQDLINLMLAQTEEDKKLNQLPPSWTRSSGPYKSNLESKVKLKNMEDKLHTQWCVIKASKRALDRMLGLCQHGQQPKAGSTSKPWPPSMETNPWDKEFSPKDFPTSHKIPSTLPKHWGQHDNSPVMLKPPTSTVMEQVPYAEIAKCSSCMHIPSFKLISQNM